MPLEIKVDVKIANYRDIIKLAAEDMARVMRDRSRADVGTVSRQFANKLTVPVKRISGGFSVQVIQRPAYSKVYEFGGVSRGKPLLWMPTSGKGRARTFRGKLFQPKGSRVLIGKRDGKVKFIGIPSVTHRRRLHLRRIAQEEVAKFNVRMVSRIR